MNIPEELIPVIDWWQKDGKKTVALAACAGAVALAVYFWVAREKRLDAEASEYAYGSNYTVQQLQDAADRYSGRDVAGMIKLRLARAYAAEGEFAKALEVFSAVADGKSVPAAFAASPEFGIAKCKEALGDWAGAKAAYDSVAADGQADATLVFEAKLGSARGLAFSGDRDGAVKALEEMKAAAGEDQAAVEAVDRSLDLAGRWQKREKPAPAVVAADTLEVPAAEAKSEVKASELTLPSAAPEAPAKEKAAPRPVKAK